MNPWELIYILAGVGAIVAIVGAIARDALMLASSPRNHWTVTDEPLGGRWYALGLAVLVGLWLTAAVLR